MSKLSEFLSGRSLYNLFLHVALIASVLIIGVLAKQNRDLKGGAAKTPQETIKEGDYFTLSDLTPVSNALRIDSVIGKQLIVVFTTRCPFCRETLPLWKSISDSVKKKSNLSVIGICLDSVQMTQTYIDQQKISFPVFVPANRESFSNKNKLHTVPQTIIRNSGGLVEKVWRGRLTLDEYTEAVKAISLVHNQPIPK
jgi:peroxiredoxin